MRPPAVDAVAALYDLIADPSCDEFELIEAYLDMKSVLALSFAALASERYSSGTSLEDTAKLIEPEFDQFPEVPATYRKVRSFSESHRILLNYLSERAGTAIDAAEINMFNGEQTETGRRVRELRSLGLDIQTVRQAGRDFWLLASPSPDTRLGAQRQMAHNILNDRALSRPEREALLREHSLENLYR